MKKCVFIFVGIFFLTTGCATAPQTNTGKGALYGTAAGAAAGALAGQIIGKDTKATLIGAAIGAAIGGASGAGVGNMMDRQEQQYRQALAASEAAAVQRQGNMLAIVFKGDVTFDTNSTFVRPGLLSEVDRIAQIMVQYPQTVIRVEGHTDSIGSEQYNQQLSERRAESVKNLLIQRGVNPYNIMAIGYGKTLPVASNATPEGRQRNRRVEIKVAPSTNS
ncbi:MAG: OmpA family protein [Desulfobacterales bacterium]|nr:OmpA family protein [Desulfobacterales bacterium]